MVGVVERDVVPVVVDLVGEQDIGKGGDGGPRGIDPLACGG